MNAVQFVNHRFFNGCNRFRTPQVFKLDAVQFVNHRFRNCMQFSS